MVRGLQFLSASAGIPAWLSPSAQSPGAGNRHEAQGNKKWNVFVESAAAYHVVPYVLHHVFRESLVVCSELWKCRGNGCMTYNEMLRPDSSRLRSWKVSVED